MSDLPRTLETAIHCVSSDIPVIIDSRISDIKTGFEGKPVSDYLRHIESDPLTNKPPGGESYQELKARVFSFVEDLLQTREECILVVSHMDPVKLMIGYFNRLSDLEILRLKVSNCVLQEFNIHLQSEAPLVVNSRHNKALHLTDSK